MAMDLFENPWAPGGQMQKQSPWAKNAIQHGWGQGNEYFSPKTKEQIRNEGLLQLAIVAAVVAAPLIIGAIGGSGAAAGSAAASGAATGAEAAGVAAGQGAAAASGAAASTAGVSAVAGGAAAAAAALQPFLKAGAAEAISQAAQMGAGELNDFMHREAPVKRRSFVFEPGGFEPLDVEIDSEQLKSISRKTTVHPSNQLLDTIVNKLNKVPLFSKWGNQIGRELEKKGASPLLETVASNPKIRKLFISQVMNSVEELAQGNPWEPFHSRNPENALIQDAPEEKEEQNNPVNVVVFPTGIQSSKDQVMRLAYESLLVSNANPSGNNGWLIVTVRSKKDAIRQLSRLTIKNLLLFSHGGYGTNSKIEFGKDVIGHPGDLSGFQTVRPRSIVLFACFISNPNIPISADGAGPSYRVGRSIMAQLARLTNATIFGNEGYSYPDSMMWNNPGDIRFVIAGVDLTWPFTGSNTYILNGAGIWNSVTPAGNWMVENSLYLNNNGAIGTLTNSWRNEPRVAAMLAAAQSSSSYVQRDTYIDPASNRAFKFRSGDGGNFVPAGGGGIR